MNWATAGLLADPAVLAGVPSGPKAAAAAGHIEAASLAVASVFT